MIRETIYFTGHNHQNEYIRNAEKVIYSDNQIGYTDNNIGFRIAATGYELNPYITLSDGLYRTTIEDYLQFYRHIGEYIGKGNALYSLCRNGRASLYVVKRKEFYGFFILTPTGATKGISIVNGGKTKKLTGSIDMKWICDNFEFVLSKYIQLLMPLRKVQEKLSSELKELGFEGKIHGCIVDIDYFHHIMLNPMEGTMTFYYSSVFGKVMELNSFEEVLCSIAKNERTSPSRIDYVKKRFIAMSDNKDCMLRIISHGNLIEYQDYDIDDRKEQSVSRSEGMYGVSSKVNSLQRLFRGHVLRDFDLRLTETKQTSFRRKKYINEMFSYEWRIYKIVEDDGSEMIKAVEVNVLEEDEYGKITKLSLTNNEKIFSISDIRAKINKKAGSTYWIRQKL